MTNTAKSLLLILLATFVSLGLSTGTAHAMTECTNPAGCAPGGSVVAPLPAAPVDNDDQFVKICLAALGYADSVTAPAPERAKCGALFTSAPATTPGRKASAVRSTAAKKTPAAKAPVKRTAAKKTPAKKPTTSKPAAKKPTTSAGGSKASVVIQTCNNCTIG